jgi:hypothetical protein
MISRSGVPSPLVSSYFPTSMVWPLTFTQSSHSGAMTRWVGPEVRLVFEADVLLLPKLIRPLVLT